MIKRYFHNHILADLNKKMVFVGGARQCGKTTFAKEIINEYPYKKGNNGIYFNWDDDEDRFRIHKREWGDQNELIVFDELHKFPRWKSWIKGIYDTSERKRRILVSGSARLDVYKK